MEAWMSNSERTVQFSNEFDEELLRRVTSSSFMCLIKDYSCLLTRIMIYFGYQ